VLRHETGGDTGIDCAMFDRNWLSATRSEQVWPNR